MNLEAMVGTPIRVDFNTLEASRGRFVRVAVIIDLNRPLLDKVEINGRWYRVEYEGFQAVCFGRGRVGHTKQFCTTEKMNYSMVQGNSDEVEATKTRRNSKEASQDGCKEVIGDTWAGGTKTREDEPAKEDRYGPWLIAKRTTRLSNRRPTSNEVQPRKDEPNGQEQLAEKKGKKAVAGNRFDLLGVEEDNQLNRGGFSSTKNAQNEARTKNHEKSQAKVGQQREKEDYGNTKRQGKALGESSGEGQTKKATWIIEKIITVGPLKHGNGLGTEIPRNEPAEVSKRKSSKKVNGKGEFLEDHHPSVEPQDVQHVTKPGFPIPIQKKTLKLKSTDKTKKIRVREEACLRILKDGKHVEKEKNAPESSSQLSTMGLEEIGEGGLTSMDVNMAMQQGDLLIQFNSRNVEGNGNISHQPMEMDINEAVLKSISHAVGWMAPCNQKDV